MLTYTGQAQPAHDSSDGFSRMRSRQPSLPIFASANFSTRSSGILLSATSRSRSKSATPAPPEFTHRAQGRDRVIIVRIDDQKQIVAGKFLRGKYGVSRSQGLLLHGKIDPDAFGRRLDRVIVPYHLVLRADHQAHLGKPGIRKPAQEHNPGTAGLSESSL